MLTPDASRSASSPQLTRFPERKRLRDARRAYAIPGRRTDRRRGAASRSRRAPIAPDRGTTPSEQPIPCRVTALGHGLAAIQPILLVGAEYPVTSRHVGIFVDQAAEPVPPQGPGIQAHSGRTLTPSGRSLATSTATATPATRARSRTSFLPSGSRLLKNTYGVRCPATLWVPKTVSPHATWAYSWAAAKPTPP